MEALDVADGIRFARAQLKRELKAGTADITEVLDGSPDFLRTMHVYDLIRALPSVGKVKASAILRRESISPVKAIGELSPRQRRVLIIALAGYRP